jgi:hypothetical protein
MGPGATLFEIVPDPINPNIGSGSITPYSSVAINGSGVCEGAKGL